MDVKATLIARGAVHVVFVGAKLKNVRDQTIMVKYCWKIVVMKLVYCSLYATDLVKSSGR